MGQSPTVRRRRLGLELRRLREASGLTLEAVGHELEWSRSKISRIEMARIAVRGRDVAEMCDLYGAEPEHRDQLVALARESKRKGWWHSFADIGGEGFQTYIGLEAEAEAIRTYESEFVPGLLQTEHYAREVYRVTALREPTAATERGVELRMARQERLRQEPALDLWAVLNEAVVRRVVGNSGLMRLQVEHLVEMVALPNVTIQVLPFAAGAHPGMGGPFVIVQFPEPVDPDVVYLEQRGGSLYLEKADDIARHHRVFDHLLARSLDPDESAKFMRRAAKELS